MYIESEAKASAGKWTSTPESVVQLHSNFRVSVSVSSLVESVFATSGSVPQNKGRKLENRRMEYT